MRKDYDIVGSYDNQRLSTINAERTVNMFEYLDEHGKRPKVLLSTAGLINSDLSFGAETGGSRATFVFKDAIYQVYGSSVFKIIGTTGALSVSLIGRLEDSNGDITSTEGYVGVDANTFQVIFVDGHNGWIWDTTAQTFRLITDTGFPVTPIDVCFIDGFFIVANGGTNNFQMSALNQGMVWSGGTATFTASSATDILTLSTSGANFQTGVPVLVSLGTGSSTFTANTGTSILTLETNNAPFQTGVPITFRTSSGRATFTADATTNILTLSTDDTNFQTGESLIFSTTGTLPNPLVAGTTYYAIMVGATTDIPGQIKVATTFANALSNTPIDLTTNGTVTNTVNSTSTLPAPLAVGTTYYSIANSAPGIVPGTIQVATSLANAMSNTFIPLTTVGSPGNTVFSTGVLPAPLDAQTTYYAILVGATTDNPGTIKLATSYANAITGMFIDLTTSGTSVNTITVKGQLQLGSITSHPGNIVACNTLHRRIFLFSENYTEVWENAGAGTNLPIRRNNSLLMEVGTPAIASVSVGFDRMFFLAQDRDGLAGVVEVKGTESIPTSNRALDFQLAQYAADPLTGVADARGILIKENGIIFYRLNFTLANHTFVFNVSMSMPESIKWHEEEVLNGDRHPAETHAYFDGVNYYGSYNEPKFYIVSTQTSTNDGEAIRRMRIGRQMTPEGYNRLRIDRFQLDLLQGADDVEIFEDIDLLAEDEDELLTESAINIILEQQLGIGNNQPIVFLSISRDGGQTYGMELIAPMGRLGERTFRTVWRKLGTTPRGQGFVPRIQFFNEIPFIILGASWDFEVLPE